MIISPIPVEILTDILHRLPAKSLLRFKTICKSWHNLINTPEFINQHVNKSNLYIIFTNPVVYMSDFDTFDNPTHLNYPSKTFEDGGLNIIGSSRGLLCFSMSWYPYTTFLYNPTTQTYKTLPFLPQTTTFCYPQGHKYLGFGYDHVSKDYKCVKIFQRSVVDEGDRFKSLVMVYSLKSDCWTRGVCDVPSYFYCHYGYSVTLNGFVHWSIEDDHRKPLPIVAFNLIDESISNVSLPEFGDEMYLRVHIGVLDECLCVMLNYWDYCHVWVMKKYGVAASWTMLCTIPKRKNLEDMEPICFSKSKMQIFVSLSLLHVAGFDLETLELTNIEPSGFGRLWSAHLCMENLLMFRDDEYFSLGRQQVPNRNTKVRKLLMKKTERILRYHATRLRATFKGLCSSNSNVES